MGDTNVPCGGPGEIRLVFAIPTITRADLLGECLRDLSNRNHVIDGLVIVDNGYQRIKIPQPLASMTVTVKSGRNLGVAGSWNMASDIAFHSFNADYCVHLNDDIVLGKDPEDIRREIRHENFPSLLIGPFHWCAFAIHRSVFDRIGRFDESFFPAYYEDRDFLYRAKLAGLHIVSDSKTLDPFHKRSSSSGGEKPGPREYYLKKWGGLPGKELYTMPFKGGSP